MAELYDENGHFLEEKDLEYINVVNHHDVGLYIANSHFDSLEDAKNAMNVIDEFLFEDREVVHEGE